MVISGIVGMIALDDSHRDFENSSYERISSLLFYIHVN